MELKVLVGYVLGAAAALGTLIAGWYLGEGRPLTFLVWVTGGILGWITGIVAFFPPQIPARFNSTFV